MTHRCFLVAFVAVFWLAACSDPAPRTDDDDDVTADDDDSAAAPDDDDSSEVDDDDVTEEPTPDPKPVLIPPGATVGTPGTMVGLSAIGDWESLTWISNQVEVTLVAPAPGGPPPLDDSLLGPASMVDPDILAFDDALKEALVPAVQATLEVER